MVNLVKKNKLVCGVGIYEKGKYAAKVDGVHTKEYSTWRSMLWRCYSTSAQNKRPRYIGCSVSENFKNFQYFAEWCNSQKGFSNEKSQLDKDLIGDGLIYSETTCVFVPLEVNCFLNNHPSMARKYLLGVTLSRKLSKYIAQISRHGVVCSLGYFNTEQEAANTYIKAKQAHAKTLAFMYKDILDDRVVLMLNNLKV
jgi:hypothetical protein